MIKEKLVLVVGAGASATIGMPVGAQLKSRIASALKVDGDRYSQEFDGDEKIGAILRRYFHEEFPAIDAMGELLSTCAQIASAMPIASSIDNYIYQHSSNENKVFCCKLAIASEISRAERDAFKSGLFSFEKLEATWHRRFFNLLTDGCKEKDLESQFKLVTIINFNYDRCLEHILFRLLRVTYNISEGKAARLTENINIIHPYGIAGHLPW